MSDMEKTRKTRGKTENPALVALLSNINEKDGLGLNSRNPGGFSAVDRNAKDEALSDIEFVVSTMVGKASERNSIPDVRAQSLCFRFMLRNCNGGNPAIEDARNQWRGALWAYILCPLMMFPFPDLHWKKVSGREIEEEHNALGKALLECLPSPNTAEWRFLTVLQDRVEIPLLDFSADQLTIPSTSLDEARILQTVFPWVEDGKHFSDPLKMTSPEALAYADQWLETRLTAGAGMAQQATQQYRGRVQVRMGELDGALAFEDVWETVLQALLLRDLVETEVSVFSLTRKLKGKALETMNRDAPADSAPMRTWDAIIEKFAYGIMLGGKFVGFLDRESLLWMPTPGYLKQTDTFRNVRAILDKELDDEKIRAVCRSRMQRLLMNFNNLPDLRQNALLASCGACDPLKTYAFSPDVKRMEHNDVALLEPRFDAMSRLCGHNSSDRDIFSQMICLYTNGSEQVYGNERFNRWAVVHGDRGDAQGGEQNAVERALMPLSACGATIVRNGDALNYITTLEITRTAQPREVRVTLRVIQGIVVYEWSNLYEGKSIRICDATEMPAVCTWPNSAVQPGQPPWKTYYTYVNFPEAKQPNRDTATVYDAGGQQISRRGAPLISLRNGEVIFTWQTHASARLPSFCTVDENGVCIGCVLFGEPASFPTYAHTAILAIDFGTTSTTGAVMLDAENPKSITVPKFQNSVLKWELNANRGVNWSIDQFIANLFNCIARTGGGDAFFTSLARFMPANVSDDQEDEAAPPRTRRRELFTDGHIFYYGNSVHDENRMGNQRYLGLKLKDISQADSVAGSNIEMFLQQVLEMYLLFCRLNGSRVTQVRFAYPLAFDQQKRQAFQNCVSELVKNTAQKAGMENCTASFTSESQAVSAYFCHILNVKAADLQQGIITLDIGGGTADYSYCRSIADQATLCDCYSSLFGGHELVGRYPYTCKPTNDTDKEKKKLRWYIEGLQDVAAHCSQEKRAEVEAFQKTLDSLTDNREDSFIFAIERFISLQPEEYAAALRTQEFADHYVLLLFELTLLLWFGYQLGTRTWKRTVNREVRIYLAGNGANLYDLIRPEDKKRIIGVAAGDGDPTLDILPNLQLKREVAEGLLRSEEQTAACISRGEEDQKQSPEDLWNEFLAVIERFIISYWDQKTLATAYLTQLMSPDEIEDTHRQFLRKNASLTDLCAYLPEFCRIVIAGMNRINSTQAEGGATT